jgi:hypothetical protein
MGKVKHLDKILKLFDKSPVVDFKSIFRIIGKQDYAKLVVSNLLRKKKIFKLAKGFYTKNNENELAVFGFMPSYIGLQSALSYYKLWEQETIPIILTSKNIRGGIRRIIDGNVFIKKMDKKYLFGFRYYKENSFYLPYSDIEKTFIDMIFFKQNISNEVFIDIKKRIDRKKLGIYLKKYPEEFRKKVSGLLSHNNL